MNLIPCTPKKKRSTRVVYKKGEIKGATKIIGQGSYFNCYLRDASSNLGVICPCINISESFENTSKFENNSNIENTSNIGNYFNANFIAHLHSSKPMSINLDFINRINNSNTNFICKYSAILISSGDTNINDTFKADSIILEMKYFEDTLSKILEQKISNKLKYKAFLGTAISVYKMKEAGLVHNDIKPENIVYSCKPNIFFSNNNFSSDCFTSRSLINSRYLVNSSSNCKLGHNYPCILKDIIHLINHHENLLTKDGYFLLIDYNISQTPGLLIQDGTGLYMAPENLKDICSFSSDIYSLGILYLKIFEPQLINNWKCEKNKLPVIIRKMLRKKGRPEIEEVLRWVYSKWLSCI